MFRTRKILKLLLFSFFFIFHSLESSAQKYQGQLIFKDGTSLKGYAEPAHQNMIRYRKERKAKKEFYSFEEVDTLKVFYDFSPTTFVYQKIENRITPMILEVARNGKNVVYYRDYSVVYNAPTSTPNGNGGFTVFGGGTSTLTHSYVRKPNEPEAIHLGSNNWMSKNFKKAAASFFSDCTELVEKIKNRELKKKNIVEIIMYYNEDCE